MALIGEDILISQSFREPFSANTAFTSDGTFAVPTGITTIRARMWGAGGGAGSTSAGGGGFTQAEVTVTPGESILVRVGGAGGASGGAGTNGGGTGGNSGVTGTGGGGGGYSGIFRTSVNQANALAMAGGGGGGGFNHVGGGGGGTSGQGAPNSGGSGGSQNAGGSGQANSNSGTALQGGNGNTSGGERACGAGGGGYFGGGAGGSGQQNGGGGGAGSGYIGAAANAWTIQSTSTTRANNSDPDVSGTLGNAGNNGYVIIYY